MLQDLGDAPFRVLNDGDRDLPNVPKVLLGSFPAPAGILGFSPVVRQKTQLLPVQRRQVFACVPRLFGL